jgi:hypothetical protein
VPVELGTQIITREATSGNSIAPQPVRERRGIDQGHHLGCRRPRPAGRAISMKAALRASRLASNTER